MISTPSFKISTRIILPILKTYTSESIFSTSLYEVFKGSPTVILPKLRHYLMCFTY